MGALHAQSGDGGQGGVLTAPPAALFSPCRTWKGHIGSCCSGSHHQRGASPAKPHLGREAHHCQSRAGCRPAPTRGPESATRLCPPPHRPRWLLSLVRGIEGPGAPSLPAAHLGTEALVFADVNGLPLALPNDGSQEVTL